MIIASVSASNGKQLHYVENHISKYHKYYSAKDLKMVRKFFSKLLDVGLTVLVLPYNVHDPPSTSNATRKIPASDASLCFRVGRLEK